MHQLGTKNELKLIGIPGHRGYERIKRANELTRAASETRFIRPEPFFGLPHSHVKEVNSWGSTERQRCAKEFIPRYSFSTSRDLLKLKLPATANLELTSKGWDTKQMTIAGSARKKKKPHYISYVNVHLLGHLGHLHSGGFDMVLLRWKWKINRSVEDDKKLFIFHSLN